MKKGIIFDMDGTIWDSSENVAKSWDIMVKKAGFPDQSITQDDIKGVMGKTMDVIADLLFPFTKEGDERNALRKACEEYENEYLRENGGLLYPDVIETLNELRHMGYHLYIVSNCQDGYIEVVIAKNKIEIVNETSSKGMKFVYSELTLYIEDSISEEDLKLKKEKDIAFLKAEIARCEGMLKNPNFVNKAPKEKVDLEKAKLAAFQERLKNL